MIDGMVVVAGRYEFAAAELEALAGTILRWAEIDRGNILPTEADAETFDLDLEDFEPGYINREEYYARQADAGLLKARAHALRKLAGQVRGA